MTRRPSWFVVIEYGSLFVLIVTLGVRHATPWQIVIGGIAYIVAMEILRRVVPPRPPYRYS